MSGIPSLILAYRAHKTTWAMSNTVKDVISIAAAIRVAKDLFRRQRTFNAFSDHQV
jgi:hypothetical protein